MRRATELLVRLKKHALDEQNLAMRGLAAALAASRNERATVECGLALELAAAWAISGGPGGASRFLAGQIERVGSLRATEQALEEAHDGAQAELLARLGRFKTMELADAAIVASTAAERERKSRLEADEGGVLRKSYTTATRVAA